MSLRNKINLATLILIVLVLFFSRHQLAEAWRLLGQVNLWIFLTIIPIQFLSYYASGAMSFAYLRTKGDLKHTSGVEAAKMALELNFVNHILPSGGVSGISYMTWRLSKLDVSSARATLAQVVRFVATFAAFVVLLVLAVLFITFDGSINRITILASSGLVSLIVIAVLLFGYLIGSKERMDIFSRWLHKVINGFWHKVLRQKNKQLVSLSKITTFFDDLHEDYVSLRAQPKQLKKSILWGFVFNASETAMFVVTFLALGSFVNPAPIFIAVGLAGLVGLFFVTPGGTGGYEAAMILFLTSAGVNAGLAVAGILLARVTLIVMTIVSGYFFYQRALKKYGSKHGSHKVGKHAT